VTSNAYPQLKVAVCTCCPTRSLDESPSVMGCNLSCMWEKLSFARTVNPTAPAGAYPEEAVHLQAPSYSREPDLPACLLLSKDIAARWVYCLVSCVPLAWGYKGMGERFSDELSRFGTC
jgi:hypothetical protein